MFFILVINDDKKRTTNFMRQDDIPIFDIVNAMWDMYYVHDPGPGRDLRSPPAPASQIKETHSPHSPTLYIGGSCTFYRPECYYTIIILRRRGGHKSPERHVVAIQARHRTNGGCVSDVYTMIIICTSKVRRSRVCQLARPSPPLPAHRSSLGR